MRHPVLVLVLLMLNSAAQGECVATPRYEERIEVVSYRPISDVAVSSDLLERTALDFERAEAILAAASGVVIMGRLAGSRPLPECGEPDKNRLSKASLPREYLVFHATCGTLPVGPLTDGFVTRPCCDELPAHSPEYALSLESLESLGPLPVWISHERLSPKNQ
jgi:hypothetical protein